MTVDQQHEPEEQLGDTEAVDCSAFNADKSKAFDAEAVLLALGEALEWTQSDDNFLDSPSYVPEDHWLGMPPFSSRLSMVMDTSSYHVDRKVGRHFTSFQAGMLPGKHSHERLISSPVHYKTLSAAKNACEQHRATGQWGESLGATLKWSQEILPGMVRGTVLGHLENEDKAYYKVAPYREWRMRFWLPRAQLYAAGIEHPKWTRNEYHTGKYKTLEEAKAACERHHATGKWD